MGASLYKERGNVLWSFLKIEGCSVSISSAIYIVILYYFSNYNPQLFFPLMNSWL